MLHEVETAIQTIEGFYIAFITSALGIIGCCFLLNGTGRIIAICSLLLFSVIAFFIKLRLVNFFLKRCAYPYEFLSVLEQMGLIKDREINWSEDLLAGPDPSQMLTRQFLADNRLATDIRIRTTGNGWRSGKKHTNEPVLHFRENGLLLHDCLYTWTNIQRWSVKEQGEYNKGKMRIFYMDDGQEKTITVNLDKAEIDKIDFLLLLTHFKAKYSPESQEPVNEKHADQ